MTTATLRLAPTFTLPVEAVTQAFAVLGRRGSGKTNTAVVLAEEMLAVGEQVVIVDPTGVWWGLRSWADGTPSNLPVVIVGGDHADLPLDERAGRALAQLLVSTRQSAVLDLSGISKSASRRVMADFLEDLYRHCRDPLHLVVDEADLLAPQRLPADMTRLLGAMEDVIRRGRAHGLGVTLITQRPAVLNKDVLTQAEVLITLRLGAPRDVAAIDEWVRLHADDDEARIVKRSLPALPVGTAWVWSPGWLGVLEQVKVRARRTFDSSATPKPGVARATAKLGANLDVEALRARLTVLLEGPKPAVKAAARTTPRSGGDDRQVARLQAQVAALTGELETARAAATRPPEPVPVLDQDARALLADLAAGLTGAVARLDAFLAAHGATPPAPTPTRAAPATRPARTEPAPTRTTPTVAPGVRAGAARMLAALAAYHPVTLTRAQLATVSKMKSTGGTYSTYLSHLRTNGLVVEDGGRLSLTDAGKAATGTSSSQPFTAADLRAQWRDGLRAGAARMFDVVVDAYPGSVSRAELAEAVEMAPSGGTFSTYLSVLRSNGLVEVNGQDVRASQTLFLEPGGS
jgi:hypothetical protein